MSFVWPAGSGRSLSSYLEVGGRSFAGSRNGYLAQVAVSATSGSSIGYLSQVAVSATYVSIVFVCVSVCWAGSRFCYLIQVAGSATWLRYEVGGR